jgi:hypothetical protein
LSIASLAFEADVDLRKRWRDQLIAAIEQALTRGELAAAVNPDQLADMLLGALWYRFLLEDAPLDDALYGEIMAMLNEAQGSAVTNS